MAGSILKRTCYYEVVNGTIRPFEWARIIHSDFGVMIEPRWPFECNNTSTHPGNRGNDDFSTDGDQRVDEFIQIDEAGLLRALNSGSLTTWHIGGRHFPRSGR